MMRGCGVLGAVLGVAMAAAGQGPTPVSAVDVEAALAGRTVQMVLVKDWIKIENTGPLVKSAQFERYCPAVDEEQVVLGRWIGVRTEGGTELPAEFASVREDEAGNLVQAMRIGPIPPKQAATVTLTTLVARRERPAPTGAFPIPKAEEYPEGVQAYLAPSAMIAADHAFVRETAERILKTTSDALEVAKAVAEMSKSRGYLPAEGADWSQPTAVAVLKHGGSCCASAVAACAVLRAAGVPAQVTYCPAGYVHGITRFWLQGYGWVRMDATSGTGKYPLMTGAEDLGLVRLFDTPMVMEKIAMAYAWPYQHNDDKGELPFRVDGVVSGQVRMYREQSDALPWVREPVPHLEPGSWSAVLGSEGVEGFGAWAELVKASREAVRSGEFGAVQERVKAGRYVGVARGEKRAENRE